jgi:serine/threonine protein kinase
MAERLESIGRYRILRELGRGAMGIVYEAHDPVLDRTVALKVIQPAVEGEAGVFEERFLTEARVAAALQHPGIVVVHDVGRDPATGVMFIALELLRGRTLASLASEGPLEWRAALGYVAQVARALHHAHLQGIVHRDVKPANVVVLPSGGVKVTDFGIARLENARQRLTTTGEFIGTPLYTAPEQAKTEDVDARADVFSLGSVAYTLLTGRAAFAAPSIPGIVHRVVYEEPEPVSTSVPGLPEEVERVLRRAMAKSPAERYPTAEALAEDVEALLAGRPIAHLGEEDLVVVESGTPAPAPPASGAALPELSLAGGGTRTVVAAPPRRPSPRRRLPRWTLGLLVVAAGFGLPGLFLWASRNAPAAKPAARVTRPSPSATARPTPPPPTPPPATPAPPTPAPKPRATPVAPGRLRIDLDHPLRRGRIRIFVDDKLELDQRLSGAETKKALVFTMHEGTFRDDLEVAPGLHEVRVEVSWDDEVRKERIVGNFRSGVTRRLEANLGRIRKDLDLEWK